MLRTLGSAAMLAAALVTTGCSSSSTAGGDTTCEEWLELEDQLDIEEKFSDADGLSVEAADVLEDALREADLSTDADNVQAAQFNILEYCGADGTGTRANRDEPISNALEN